LKVLHIITGLGVGGAEMQLRSMLQHTRHDCDVVTLYNPGPVAEMIRADGARVADVGMTRNTQLSTMPKLRRLIAAGGYDVVHCHLYRSQIYGRPAAWLARTPVIVTTEHSIGETHLERREMTAGVRALYLATERLSDATIAVSETVRERMIKWGVRDSRIAVIPNGVDLARVAFDATARAKIRAEFGIGDGEYVIGVLGRLDPNKQFDLVIEASAALLGDKVKLMVVGKGAEQEHLDEVTARCQVASQVIFTGERHDVAAMLSAMDLFVASSAQETFGLSVLEALANGAPVLYTTCPALTGLEVSRAEQVPSTVAGLRTAMEQEIGAGQRDRRPEPAVEKEYGISAVTARIDDLYEQLAARRTWRTLGRRARRGRPARPAPARAGASMPPAYVRASAAASEPAPVTVPDSPAAQSAEGQR
jgi:glycosyltransferase involved in cell wall biosynthesis